MSTDLPDIGPRADRVIAHLQQEVGRLAGQNAMLEDVVAQLQAERVAAAAPTTPDRATSAAAGAEPAPTGTAPTAS